MSRKIHLQGALSQGAPSRGRGGASDFSSTARKPGRNGLSGCALLAVPVSLIGGLVAACAVSPQAVEDGERARSYSSNSPVGKTLDYEYVLTIESCQSSQCDKNTLAPVRSTVYVSEEAVQYYDDDGRVVERTPFGTVVDLPNGDSYRYSLNNNALINTTEAVDFDGQNKFRLVVTVQGGSCSVDVPLDITDGGMRNKFSVRTTYCEVIEGDMFAE